LADTDGKPVSRSSSIRLVRLAQEAAEASSTESEEALRYALGKVAEWIGATNAYWVAAVRERRRPRRDPMLGWRAREVLYLRDHAEMIRRTREMVGRIHKGEIDLASAANVRRAGSTRCFLRYELVPDAIWKDSWMANEFQIPRGIYDQLVSAQPVAPDRESYLGLVRGAGDPRFSSRDRDLLLLFTEASRLFQRRLMFFRGWTAHNPLTSREREVLVALCSEQTEKEIARRLRIGERTVHQHASAVYGKLGVRGRYGLLAARP
jgi:DNA-binding CsgD family transcriptional regulator